MPTGTLDVACDKFGGQIGLAGLHQRDEFAVLAHDCGASREGEVETPGNRPQNLAMLPPELRGMAVVMPLVHHGVECRVEFAVPEYVGKVVLFDQALDTLKLGNVLAGCHVHEPSRQSRLDQYADL